MDRNLGAAYNSYHEEGGVRIKGLLYQWGRKDPFVPAIGWENNEPDQPLYNSTGEKVTLSREVVSEVNNFLNSVHHPLTFYASPTSYLWYSSARTKLIHFYGTPSLAGKRHLTHVRQVGECRGVLSLLLGIIRVDRLTILHIMIVKD